MIAAGRLPLAQGQYGVPSVMIRVVRMYIFFNALVIRQYGRIYIDIYLRTVYNRLHGGVYVHVLISEAATISVWYPHCRHGLLMWSR